MRKILNLANLFNALLYNFFIKISTLRDYKVTFQECENNLYHNLKNLEKSLIKLKIKLLSIL